MKSRTNTMVVKRSGSIIDHGLVYVRQNNNADLVLDQLPANNSGAKKDKKVSAKRKEERLRTVFSQLHIHHHQE